MSKVKEVATNGVRVNMVYYLNKKFFKIVGWFEFYQSKTYREKSNG